MEEAKEHRIEEAAKDCLVLLGFARGDVEMAVCIKAGANEQQAIVFLRDVRAAGAKSVADCSRCREEHEVEGDFFQAIGDGWVDVNRRCDAGATLIDLADIYAVRLAETRKATSKRRAS